MSQKNENGTGRKLSKGMLFGIIGSAAAIIVIAILVGVIVNMSQAEPVVERERVYVTPDVGGRGTVVTEENIDEVLADLGKPVEDSSYSVKMNMDWHFPSGAEPSTNAYVANSVSNKRTVYFDVILSGTNELVYSSPYLPVGSELANFTLDAPLEAGVYDAVVVYHLVDDDLNEITTASVTVTLNVEN